MPPIGLLAVPVVIGCAWLVCATFFAFRRVRRAQHGERLLLRRRNRITRVYHRLRDGRVYHPDRNPEITRVIDEDEPQSPLQ